MDDYSTIIMLITVRGQARSSMGDFDYGGFWSHSDMCSLSRADMAYYSFAGPERFHQSSSGGFVCSRAHPPHPRPTV